MRERFFLHGHDKVIEARKIRGRIVARDVGRIVFDHTLEEARSFAKIPPSLWRGKPHPQVTYWWIERRVG